jgi:hypothetical protein
MKILRHIFVILLVCIPLQGVAEDSDGPALLDVGIPEDQAAEGSRVTAVYGISADDYLPVKQVARKSLRPRVRRPRSRPAFDLPDAFYFIGGPIFLLLFLRVLVIFLNGFEEKRREEMRAAASQSPNPE